ncbi:MAG: Carbonic anhydrase [Pedosphaera sp.]|nr:Carbonic anhydrase [Pedosphaera sp.]
MLSLRTYRRRPAGLCLSIKQRKCELMKIAIPFIISSCIVLGGCATGPNASKAEAGYVTQTREMQAAVTPAQALALLKDGNERFVAGRGVQRDWPMQVQKTSGGQFPFAVVLGCIDSRSAAELIFDQGIGDIFDTRIAGNVVDNDVLGGLEFATEAGGAKLIVVVGHTSCGAVKEACDQVKLGHFTELLARIEPAIAKVESQTGEARSSKNAVFVDKVVEANVRQSMQVMREQSPIIKELIEHGKVDLVGAIYDLQTGRVKFLKDEVR